MTAARVFVSGGDLLTGFTRGEVTLSIDEIAASFSLDYVLSTAQKRSPGERALFAGDRVSVFLGDDLVLGGYVDAVDDDDAPDALRTRAQGRSVTGDLVDCTAEHPQLSGMTVVEIARALCKPFGVSVLQVGPPGASFATWNVQRGESVADAIIRAATRRGLSAYAVGDKLVIAPIGTLRTETLLVRGRPPLLHSAASESWVSRYSTYVFRGQVRATDRMHGKDAAALKHLVTDDGVTRYRPLQLTAEAHSRGDLRTRTEAEAARRAGKSSRVLATLDGHRTAEGYVWRPNLRVRFRNPALDVDEELLVSRCSMRFGAEEPDITELELVAPSTYALDMPPALRPARKKKR